MYKQFTATTSCSCINSYYFVSMVSFPPLLHSIWQPTNFHEWIYSLLRETVQIMTKMNRTGKDILILSETMRQKCALKRATKQMCSVLATKASLDSFWLFILPQNRICHSIRTVLWLLECGFSVAFCQRTHKNYVRLTIFRLRSSSF